MSFTNGLSERMGELRFPKSPNDETPYSGYVSPPRGHNLFVSPFQTSSNDIRSSLQRRFTTDSSKITTLTGIGAQNPQISKSHISASYEKKRLQIEQVREQKRKFEAQMKLLDLQEQRLQQSANAAVDTDQFPRGFSRHSLTGGPVSEPTTPPDYSDAGFPTSLSKPNRFSINSLTSPPGLSNRFSQSSSQLASSPSGMANQRNQQSKQPAKSVPGSRRNSDDEEYFPEELLGYRTGASRYSMPTQGSSSRKRSSIPAQSSASQQRASVPVHAGLGPLNTTSFLFDDNDDNIMSAGSQGVTSPKTGTFLMTSHDDTFPTLRSDRTSGVLSANPAAHDLANSRSTDAENWASFTRPRPNHQSMPQTGLSIFRPVLNNQQDDQNLDQTIAQARLSTQKPQRHSMGVPFGGADEAAGGVEQGAVNTVNPSNVRPVSLQSSYSTNDLPTRNSLSAVNSALTMSYAEQQLHNHNANLGRIPHAVASNRQSHDFQPAVTSAEHKRDEKAQTGSSVLQASAAPFGPSPIVAPTSDIFLNASVSTFSTFGNGGYGYNLMQNYGMGQAAATASSQPQSAPSSVGSQYPVYGGFGRIQDNQSRAATRSRPQVTDAARYDNTPLDEYRGRLYDLCKDQHGCRYLQKRLEERNPDATSMIFIETLPFVIELMTDPFGNYLCQKLLEFSENDQRTQLIAQAAPAMVSIALNQHGTRALQKMVEYVGTVEQIEIIVAALQEHVVELVQDLNGNHVIQKCLNKLGSENSQFIFDAVGLNCVTVGTHRHGCCVLQRCIDHAKGTQRANLIAAITSNAFTLVQDPFGNYVVQYILDLNEPLFTKPLCMNFSGNIPALSKQKFSSNVIEKCLRTADHATKRFMVDEMLQPNEIERMLRDAFANYVVQTALEKVDDETKLKMIEVIRPILPAIKHTPHGRRILGKITAAEGQVRNGGAVNIPSGLPESAPVTPGRINRSNTESVGRRQFQIYGQHGMFHPNPSPAPRYPGYPDGSETFGPNDNANPPRAMAFNGSGMYGNRPVDPAYSGYNGAQPGPGYI